MIMPTKTEDGDSNNTNQPELSSEGQVCNLRPYERLREGMLCPRCKAAKIEYNGLLNLVCPNCGLKEVGVST